MNNGILTQYQLPVAMPYGLLGDPAPVPLIDRAYSYDSDAASYIRRVESADGAPLELAVRVAINNFVLGCKQDGIWTAIKASCILAGARTLTGALVPLVGTAPTSFNFVDANYNRKTGLLGDGTTKYLNSNRSDGASPQNSNHICVYVSTAHNYDGFPIYLGTVNANDPFNGIHIGRNGINGQLFTRNNSGTFNLFGTGSQVGVVGTSRPSSSSADVRSTGVTTSYATTSTSPHNINVLIFANLRTNGSVAQYSNGRLAFYSIGDAINLGRLDAHVTALYGAIGAAIS